MVSLLITAKFVVVLVVMIFAWMFGAFLWLVRAINKMAEEGEVIEL